MEKDKTLLIIAEVVAESNGREAAFLFKNTRKRENVDLRSEFHFFAQRYSKLSLTKIGEFSQVMGRRRPHDHSTVIHNRKKVKDYTSVDKKYNERIERLDEIIKSLVDYETGEERRSNERKQEIVSYIYQDSDSEFIELFYELTKLQYETKNKQLLSEFINISKNKADQHEGIHKTTPVNP
jgi:hypothetical protein